MKTFKKLIAILLIASVAASMLSFGVSATNGVIAWGAANSAGDGVRIRSGPGLNHEVLTHANRGDPIVIIERTNSEWYRVNFNGTIGYVNVPLLERPRTVADFNANGKVVGTDVNMRERPSTDSASLGTYAKDTVMSIIGLNEGWFKVRFGDKTGYIRSDLMTLVASNGTAASSGSSSASITGKVTGSKVNMRETPSTSAEILGTYALGTVMDVLGIDNGWYKVAYDGKTGYMHCDFMQASSPPPAPAQSAAAPSSYVEPSGTAPSYNAALSQQIVDLALSLKGSKYVFGGASPSGFDCSGFTYYVYKQLGINLTRNASGQYRDNGTHISKSDLQPGDLVFTSSNGRSVTHVGIYIGDNKMIHASTATTGVIITTLDSSNYSRTIFAAKRVA